MIKKRSAAQRSKSTEILRDATNCVMKHAKTISHLSSSVNVFKASALRCEQNMYVVCVRRPQRHARSTTAVEDERSRKEILTFQRRHFQGAENVSLRRAFLSFLRLSVLWVCSMSICPQRVTKPGCSFLLHLFDTTAVTVPESAQNKSPRLMSGGSSFLGMSATLKLTTY